jgi:phosphotransacetylase
MFMDKPISKLRHIADRVISLHKKWKVAVVMGEDEHTMDALCKAMADGFIYPVFIGDQEKIKSMIKTEMGEEQYAYQVISCTNPKEAAIIGVALVKKGEADMIMKGLIHTDLFLKAILNKETGLMLPKATLSYVCALEIPRYHKLLMITDPAVIPFPNLEQKMMMARYAVHLAHQLGIKTPKLALISASEKVSTHMPNSLDYMQMCEMTKQGAIENCVIDGPLDLFLACDPESVRIKGFSTPVNGDADILLFPTIEACNPFYKGLMLFGGGELAGLIQGTTHPVIVMSRSESFKSKYYCLALACLMTENTC